MFPKSHSWDFLQAAFRWEVIFVLKSSSYELGETWNAIFVSTRYRYSIFARYVVKAAGAFVGLDFLLSPVHETDVLGSAKSSEQPMSLSQSLPSFLQPPARYFQLRVLTFF